MVCESCRVRAPSTPPSPKFSSWTASTCYEKSPPHSLSLASSECTAEAMPPEAAPPEGQLLATMGWQRVDRGCCSEASSMREPARAEQIYRPQLSLSHSGLEESDCWAFQEPCRCRRQSTSSSLPRRSCQSECSESTREEQGFSFNESHRPSEFLRSAPAVPDRRQTEKQQRSRRKSRARERAMVPGHEVGRQGSELSRLELLRRQKARELQKRLPGFTVVVLIRGAAAKLPGELQRLYQATEKLRKAFCQAKQAQAPMGEAPSTQRDLTFAALWLTAFAIVDRVISFYCLAGHVKMASEGADKPPKDIKETPGPRKRIMWGQVFLGQVVDWKGKYGWIQPAEPIFHAKASMRQGRVFISRTDLVGCRALMPGVMVQFQLYEDNAGLGAQSCCVLDMMKGWPQGKGRGAKPSSKPGKGAPPGAAEAIAIGVPEAQEAKDEAPDQKGGKGKKGKGTKSAERTEVRPKGKTAKAGKGKDGKGKGGGAGGKSREGKGQGANRDGKGKNKGQGQGPPAYAESSGSLPGYMPFTTARAPDRGSLYGARQHSSAQQDLSTSQNRQPFVSQAEPGRGLEFGFIPNLEGGLQLVDLGTSFGLSPVLSGLQNLQALGRGNAGLDAPTALLANRPQASSSQPGMSYFDLESFPYPPFTVGQRFFR
ncbi:unnamed protein product [Effrenium voratum]|nr:unnamed protein product [Effrenium voratum]